MMSELERNWRNKRKEEREKHVTAQTNVNISTWYNTLPNQIKTNLEPIINNIIEKSELSKEEQSNMVQKLHTIIPEYPYYHWRHLHSTVQDASRTDYQKQDYYRAFEETVKRYISQTKNKSKSTNSTDHGLMGEAYGKTGKLKVAGKYKKPNGNNFSVSTIENIEEGQKFFSMGTISGARNPIAHEEVIDLKDSGLFSEEDCLDVLSLLSHLFRRLDDATEKS